MPKFDLQRAVVAEPYRTKRSTILEHPRVAEWLEQLMALRKARGISLEYIAQILTKGCHAEGILPPDQVVSEYKVRRWWRRNGRG